MEKNKKRINESTPELAEVAAGIAAVIGSGVGLAGLMEYLKKKYPKAYAAMSELGSAASDSISRGVNLPEGKGVNESTPDLAEVAAGIAAVVASGVGIAGLMDYLKAKYPKVYRTLSDLGSAATDSRARGVNVPGDGVNESMRLTTISESLSRRTTKVNEASASDEQLARIDNLKEAYGVDEFIINFVMKLDNDTLNSILDTMERDMGISDN